MKSANHQVPTRDDGNDLAQRLEPKTASASYKASYGPPYGIGDCGRTVGVPAAVFARLRTENAKIGVSAVRGLIDGEKSPLFMKKRYYLLY